MTTATHNYGWLMPDPGGSANTWGNTLNGTTQAIDAKVQSINNQVQPNVISVSRGPDSSIDGLITFGNNGNTQLRWVMGETSEPEGAGNTGTNFYLNAYDNSGNYLGQAFEVIRGTQNVTFSQAVTVGGALNVTGGVSVGGVLTAGNHISSSVGYQCKAGSGGGFDGNMFNIEWPGSQAHLWIDNNNQGAIVIDNGSSMTIAANITCNGGLSVGNSISSSVGYQCKVGSGGGFDNNTFNIEWPGSQAHLWIDNNNQGAIVTDNGSSMNIAANITCNGGLNAHGDIWGYNGNIYIKATGVNNSNVWFVNSSGTNVGVVYYSAPNNEIIVQNQIGGGQLLLDGAANFYYAGSGNANKPGGGAWAATSDARIKTVMGSYSAGLEQVAKLNPVRFTYKGNDGDAHALVKGKTFIGLVADEAMRAMPEMVSLSEGEIDGRKVNDLKTLDPTALIYALINSVKELKAEIEALKASR